MPKKDTKDGTMPWPDAGNPELPAFDGRGVTRFLETYNRLGDIRNASDESRAGMLEFYCKDNVKRFLQSLGDDYEEYNWAKIQAALKDCYPDDHEFRTRYTLDDLRQYVKQVRDIVTQQDFAVYYGDFKPYATYLEKKQLLTAKTSARYFAFGLPMSLRKEILEIARKDKQLAVAATIAAKPAGERTDLADEEEEPTLEELKKAGLKYFKQNRAYFDIAAEMHDPDVVDAEKEYPVTIKKKGTSSDQEARMDTLTKQLAEMQIQLLQANQRTVATTGPPVVTPGYQRTVTPATGSNAYVAKPCIYDGQVNGCTRNKLACPELLADIRAGKVKVADDLKRTLLFPSGEELPYSPGRMIEAVRQNSSMPDSRQTSGQVQAQVITFDSYEPPAVSSGHKVYQISRGGDAEEYEVDLGEKRSAPDDDQDDSRNVRSRSNNTEPPSRTVRFSPSEDLRDRDMSPESSPEPVKVPRHPSTTKWAWVDQDVDVEEVARRILETQISLPAKTVISLSTDLGSKIAELSKKKRVPVPTTTPYMKPVKVTTAGTSAFPVRVGEAGNSSPDRRLPYRQPLGKLMVNIGGVDVRMLVDPGAEVNLIASTLMERISSNLIQRPLDSSAHTLTGIVGRPEGITSICEDVVVRAGAFEGVAHFFVANTAGPCEVLAGLPFLRSCDARLYFSGGNLRVGLVGMDGNEYHVGLNKSRPEDFHRPSSAMQAAVNYVSYEEDASLPLSLCRTPSGDTPLHVNTAYKPVGVKVRPLGEQLPEKYSKARYFRPALPRDPYAVPLSLPAPSFIPQGRLTEERLSLLDFGPEGFINNDEKNFLLSILQMHERAIAFDRTEKGCLSRDYASDYEVPVIEHKPWVDKPIPIPKALLPRVIELLNAEIAAGDLEPSFSAYATRWFIVPKKDNKLRKVVDASSMNRITIRDVGLPPDLHDFVQDFIGHASYGLADLFSGYDQRQLHETSRDTTTIRTPIGVFRHTKLLQGATNSVAEFQRSVNWVYQEEIPSLVRPFIDDLAIKGPTSTYGDELQDSRFSIRKFVWEHGVKFERLLLRTEHAGLTISGPKFAVITPALNVLGHIVSKDGVSMSKKLLNKIQQWATPFESTKELRGFLGTVGAVRQFVPSFAKHDAPLRKLLHKQNDFIWTAEHTRAVEALKEEVGQDRILVKLVYGTDRRIILAVDSSQIAAGFALFQEDEHGVRRPARFDSVPFNEVESRYSQPKLELCGVFKALKRCRLHLYGQRFTLEVDARSLVQMLNSPDLPSSPMTRWLAFIKLFDLEVVHVPAGKHILVDGLSRAYFTDDVEEDLDSPIKASHSVLAITDQLPENPTEDRLFDDLDEAPVLHRTIHDSPDPSLIDLVPEGWKDLVSYLISGTVPGDFSKEARKALLNKAETFFVGGRRIYRRSKTGINQQVVFDSQEQEKIVLSFHEIAHRGISAVAQAVCQRYWWSGMHKTLREVIRACDACQRRARDHPQPRELLRPTIDTCHLFQKVAIDIVHMGQGSGPYPYLVLARDDLSGWVEGRALANKTAEAVSDFFQEEIFSRYGPILDVIVNDNGKEFQGEYAQWIKELEIDHRQSTPYNPQAHGAIERGHAQIFEAICKIAVGKRDKWSKFLPAVLYADRITTRRTTGYSAFELVYGALPCLPLDVDLITWVYTDWSFPMTTGELLYQRTRQIVRSEEMQHVAAQRLAKSRKASSTYMDEKMAHRLREPLKVGEFVLVHDSALATAFTRKMDNRWYGPFLILRQHAKGSYFLAELDGTPRVVPVAPSRLRKNFPSGRKPLSDLPAELFMPVSLPKKTVP